MGFGPIFLGIMFLFDAQAGLRAADGSVHMMLDLFPDLVGWLLLFRGLTVLSEWEKAFLPLKRPAFLMGMLAAFSLAKDTILFPYFYTASGSHRFSVEIFDFCEHLLILAFLYVLFQKMVPFARKHGEDKLAIHHRTVPTLVLAEGGIFVLSKILSVLSVKELESFAVVVSRLDYLFWIFLVWFAVIAMVRSMIRITD